MRTAAQIGLVLSTAILLRLLYPVYDLHFLAWIALVPLFLSIRISEGPWRSAFLSLAAGYLYYTLLMWWGLRLDGIHIANFVLLVLCHSWYFGVFGFLGNHFHRRMPRWSALSLPSLWVVLEYVKSHAGFLGIPWGVLGYSQYDVPAVSRAAAITGVYGVSFLIVLVNAVIAESVPVRIQGTGNASVDEAGRSSHPALKCGILGGCLLLLVIPSISPVSAAEGDVPARTLRVALIQGNTYWDPRRDAFDPFLGRTYGKYRDLTMAVKDRMPDLVAWPLSSVPGVIPVDRRVVDLLADVARGTRAYFLVGTAGFDKLSRESQHSRRVANSAFLFAPAGHILDRYDKRKLLPFDEYLPLRGYFPWPSWLVSPEMKDHSPGTKLTIFDMFKRRFGVLICSENLWPETFREMASRGVDFMVAMTNEGYTDDPAARYMLLAMYRFRAIENHVALLRSDTRGVSAAIAPDGRMIGRVANEAGSDIDVEGTLVAEIPLSRERTFYNRRGNVFLQGLFVITAVCLAMVFVPKHVESMKGER